MLAQWWDKHAVPRLIGYCCSQKPIMRERARIVPQASGDVLELGCGGGINLGLYDRSRVNSLAGIDPSPELMDRARASARDKGFTVDFRAGYGENMPFADASFDTVLTTFTLCSVTDPVAVAQEMRRVLRPGGRILFLEHGRAPDASAQKWQNRIEPVWKHLAGGCHLTRPVIGLFKDQGFAVSATGQEYMPKTPRAFGWVEWGEARVG